MLNDNINININKNKNNNNNNLLQRSPNPWQEPKHLERSPAEQELL
jgi:phage portal protein BeeE